MDLAAVHEELVHEIRQKFCYVAEIRSAADLADLFDDLVAELEALALCHLLELGDPVKYQLNLARAAQARRYFLLRSAAEGNHGDRHLALSRNRGFLGAVVAGTRPLAEEIARASRAPFDPSWEYEDDHCFYHALHCIVLGRGTFPDAEIAASTARFAEVLEGAFSPELAALEAIAARDSAALEEALEALVSAAREKNDAALGSPRVLERDILVWPARRVSIEALALLNVAELRGMTVAKELPLCPRLGRLAWTDRPFRDLFQVFAPLP